MLLFLFFFFFQNNKFFLNSHAYKRHFASTPQTFSNAHIHGSDRGLNEQQTSALCVVWKNTCVCVRALSRRPANTLSRGGSLIYKALNEGQQRRGARTSVQLIVCLFTFTFRFHPLHLPPSTHVTQRKRRRRRTRTPAGIHQLPA